MKKLVLTALLSLGLVGCKTTEHDLFSLTKGENTPLISGTYACEVEKSRPRAESGAPSGVLGNLMRHLTTLKDVIEVTEIRHGSAVRYLITSKDDPTSGSVYAFHSLGNSIFAYSLPKPEGKGQIIQFMRLDGKKIEHIGSKGHPDEALLAKKHNLSQSRESAMPDLGPFAMKGTRDAEGAFLRELSGDSKFFETLATCLPVSG